MNDSIKPIKPDEIGKIKVENLPEIVIISFNELITERFHGGSATFKQDEVVDRIISKEPNLTQKEIFDKHYLDVENMYREIGWKVKYNKPAYNETYPATFTFEK